MHHMDFMVGDFELAAIFVHCQIKVDILGRGKKITHYYTAEAPKWFASGTFSFKVQDHTHESLPDCNFLRKITDSSTELLKLLLNHFATNNNTSSTILTCSSLILREKILAKWLF